MADVEQQPPAAAATEADAQAASKEQEQAAAVAAGGDAAGGGGAGGDASTAGQDADAADAAAAAAGQQPAADAAGAGAAEQPAAAPAEELSFRITFGKNSQELKRPASLTVGELKALIEQETRVPKDKQRLMNKGAVLKDDAASLAAAGVKNGSKLLLVGSSASAGGAGDGKVAAAGSSGGGDGLEWDSKQGPEDICAQPQHKKVLDKGPPDDAMPGVAGRQVPLPDEVTHINGLYNSTGTKVRLTFKDESQSLWIASATATQKIPYSSVSKIGSWPVTGKEEYSVVALHLGAGGASKYWLYFVPSQYVAGLKIRIIGVHALL